MLCLNHLESGKWNQDSSVDELCNLSSLIIWYPHHSDSHRVVCHPISLFKLQANGSFGDMTGCHFTCWPAFELQVLSCVCLFREITAVPHLPSPLSVSNGSSTNKIQVRVYIWVTCYAMSIFTGCDQMCVFNCMSLWVENSSICTFSRIVMIFFRAVESCLKWVLWLFATALLLMCPADRGRVMWKERRYTNRVTRQDNEELYVGLLQLPGAWQFAKWHSTFTLNCQPSMATHCMCFRWDKFLLRV